MEKETAQTLVTAWLESEGRKLTWLAAQIPVNRTTLWIWLNGSTVPKLEHRRRLQDVTGLPVAQEEKWISRCARGKVDMKTALYRHFDADGTLLYVGVSDCLSTRDKQHAATSHWHDEVCLTKTEWLIDRTTALKKERAAISAEKPRHNIRFASAISASESLSDLAPPDIIAHIRESGRTVAAVCREADITRETFYKVIKPGAPANLGTILAISRATGLKPSQIKPELAE